MSAKERGVLRALHRYADGAAPQGVAAKEAGVCQRHFRRLLQRWRKEGDAALASKRRGAASGRSREADRSRFLAWYEGLAEDGRYRPTHASEMFRQETGVSISKETARRWLTAAGLWKPKRTPQALAHKPRPRRARRGELIQIDGSEHAWGGGHKFVLLQFIDDATSQLMHACFVESENTRDYLDAMRGYLLRHGVPRVLYTDRHSVFYNNGKPEVPTQFGRAMRELGIDMLPSPTPQSRGRVERAHFTAQDRLAKELANNAALDGCDLQTAIARANAYLPKWIKAYNAKPSRGGRAVEDAHRPLTLNEGQLDRILCKRHRRKMTDNCAFSFGGGLFVVVNHQVIGRWRRGAGVVLEIREECSGRMSVWFGERELSVRRVEDAPEPPPLADGRGLNAAVDSLLDSGARRRHVPPASHPWKAASYQAQMRKKQQRRT